MDELEAHIRWVAADAGLQVGEAAIQSALAQGGGSARDTLSALELLASTGDDEIDSVDLGEFVEAMVDLDPGRALTAVAHAVQQGRDPRTLTEEIVRTLRDCFLSLMAPELVPLPESQARLVTERAARLGAARTVRAMERLGEILVEMRHAPDPRLLLEVVLVQLTHEPAAPDISSILDRLDRLERGAGDSTAATPRPIAPSPSPVDPSTGRVPLGGRARAAAAQTTRPAPATVPTAAAPAAPAPAAPAAPAVAAAAAPAPRPDAVVAADEAPAALAQPAAPATPATPATPVAASAATAEQAATRWSGEIVPALKPLVRAIYSVPKVAGVRDGTLLIAAPNEAHRAKCEQHRADVEAAIVAVLGGKVGVQFVVDAAHDDAPAAAAAAAAADAADHEIDLHDLVDAPPDSVVSPIDRLAQAFPGSELLDERR
jgi:DNA polymerase-3 subunit gamma/tau